MPSWAYSCNWKAESPSMGVNTGAIVASDGAIPCASRPKSSTHRLRRLQSDPDKHKIWADIAFKVSATSCFLRKCNLAYLLTQSPDLQRS